MNQLRWIRLLAIATAAVILASCRSLTAPLTMSSTAIMVLPDDVMVATDHHGDGLLSDTPLTAALMELPGPAEASTEPAPQPAPAMRRDERIVPVGLEAPCPPLPRLGVGGGRCGPAGCQRFPLRPWRLPGPGCLPAMRAGRACHRPLPCLRRR